MKFKIILPLLAIVFVAAACNKSQPADTNTNTQNQNQAGSSDTPLSGTVEITLTAQGVRPSEVTVKKGTTVVFKNNDTRLRWPASAPHPTHTDYPEFDPKKGINPGESWSFTFDQTGSWKHHDHLNPSSANQGVVVVVE